MENKKITELLQSSGTINEENITQIKRIKEINDLARTFPIWPFNYKIIYTFIGSIFLLIFISIINILITRFFP